jgi:DNA-binding HxlR family transcriptional regulator
MYDVMSPACPTRQVITHVGQKWSALVLYALESGEPLRFSELRRVMADVSQKSLTQTLRQLERDGFVERTAHPTVPVTVEYRLTPLGRELSGVVAAIREFAYATMPRIEAARVRYDARGGPGDGQPAAGRGTTIPAGAPGR